MVGRCSKLTMDFIMYMIMDAAFFSLRKRKLGLHGRERKKALFCKGFKKKCYLCTL